MSLIRLSFPASLVSGLLSPLPPVVVEFALGVVDKFGNVGPSKLDAFADTGALAVAAQTPVVGLQETFDCESSVPIGPLRVVAEVPLATDCGSKPFNGQPVAEQSKQTPEPQTSPLPKHLPVAPQFTGPLTESGAVLESPVSSQDPVTQVIQVLGSTQYRAWAFDTAGKNRIDKNISPKPTTMLSRLVFTTASFFAF
jgi:hypothetical protein